MAAANKKKNTFLVTRVIAAKQWDGTPKGAVELIEEIGSHMEEQYRFEYSMNSTLGRVDNEDFYINDENGDSFDTIDPFDWVIAENGRPKVLSDSQFKEMIAFSG